jgi:hypothetical protein
MDETNNNYTAYIEIGELLQGKNIMTADVKIWGLHNVDGVAMKEHVLVEVENVGPLIMALHGVLVIPVVVVRTLPLP